jgi:hypothetical protein
MGLGGQEDNLVDKVNLLRGRLDMFATMYRSFSASISTQRRAAASARLLARRPPRARRPLALDWCKHRLAHG